METKWDKYVGLPFKHLGINPETGIDCFNLITHIYKEERNIIIPYTTRDWCDILDEDWYSRTHERLIESACFEEHGWQRVKELKEYDAITMMLGSSTITNHVAMYIGNNQIIHILPRHKSHIATYGNYYKQYTTGCFRWIHT